MFSIVTLVNSPRVRILSRVFRKLCRHRSVRASDSDVSIDSDGKKVALRAAADRRAGRPATLPLRTARATMLVKLDGGGPVRANGASIVACFARKAS